MKKIIWLVLPVLVLAAFFLFWKRGPMDKYRESKIIGGKLMTVDVCLGHNEDTKKVSRALEDAWQQMRDVDHRADGSAVDQAVVRLHKHGIRHFLIDAAGDSYASGLNCSRKPWTIAVKSAGANTAIIDIIEVSNASISTYVADRSVYSKSVLSSATVIAPSVKDGRGLLKVLLMKGLNEGMAAVDAKGKKYAAIAVGKGGSRPVITKSANYKKFQIKRRR